MFKRNRNKRLYIYLLVFIARLLQLNVIYQHRPPIFAQRFERKIYVSQNANDL